MGHFSPEWTATRLLYPFLFAPWAFQAESPQPAACLPSAWSVVRMR